MMARTKSLGAKTTVPSLCAWLVHEVRGGRLRELLFRQVELDVSARRPEQPLLPAAELVAKEQIYGGGGVLVFGRLGRDRYVASTKSLADLFVAENHRLCSGG